MNTSEQLISDDRVFFLTFEFCLEFRRGKMEKSPFIFRLRFVIVVAGFPESS
jgi:hypothetical protein